MTKTVVIVGGGSAGWLTAGIIAARHNPLSDDGQGIKVILLESPDVANLGVGEGTWPTMRDTLRQIGLSEVDFLRSCDVSFKQGSQFINWQRGEGESYYHPFIAPGGYGSVNLAAHWLHRGTNSTFADVVCPQGKVCDLGLAPKTPQTPEYAFSLNYGYHLNAGKFVELLQRHCVEKLGVEYQLGHVDQVLSAENGDIAALSLTDGKKIHADLFVDCTGFAALLIGKHYNVPFVSQRDCLFNDTALAVQTNHASEDTPIASCTKSTAQSSGWVWDIALPTRRGIGHVFSSQHVSIGKAEDELQRYLDADPALAKDQPSPRKITFQPGHRESFWHKNCVAVGVSAGFVEPLEASALVLIEKSAEFISNNLPQDRSAMTVVAKRFNDIIGRYWIDIIDFLKLHYVLSERTDSEYWREHRESQTMPDSLRDSLDLWRSHVPWVSDSNNRVELFSAASIQYVLYGMGFVTDINSSRYRSWNKDAALADRLMQDNLGKTEALMASQPTNRDLLNLVRGG
ncbi:MAG: tryptophan halogenase [Porticoccaceae bacterium]|nr:tryptophan halogenase [Porticoccaceae bacterium]MDG2115872.1 tryptophan 7-halogenase [Porticoccaceae bacterium]